MQIRQPFFIAFFSFIEYYHRDCSAVENFSSMGNRNMIRSGAVPIQIQSYYLFKPAKQLPFI